MTANDLKRVTVIVPSYNPDEKLKQVVEGLISVGFSDILIVNDGSKDSTLDQLKSILSRADAPVTVFGGKYAGVTTWGGVYSDGQTVYYASGSPAGAAMARFSVPPTTQHSAPVC